MMNKMTLTIPARGEWTLVLRMAASGVGTVFELPLDVMDDLKTALDESCELLTHQPVSVSSLTMECVADADGLHVSLTGQQGSQRLDDEPADADVAGLIIGALVKEVHLCKENECVCAVQMLLPAQNHGC